MDTGACTHATSMIYALYVFQDSSQETETTPYVSVESNLVAVIKPYSITGHTGGVSDIDSYADVLLQ